MMYLSQLILNPQSRHVLDDLADPYEMHRTVMSGFPQELPDGERVLFRLEIQPMNPYLVLLVQSHTPPDWQALSQHGYLLHPAVVKTFELHPAVGQTFRFRLAANPTKRLRGDGKNDGNRIGLEREEDQLKWLSRKSDLHGFRVLAARTAKINQPDGCKVVNGKKQHIRQFAVRFDGILQVTDVEVFSLACRQGIGSGKGMGFGLLSLASA